MTSSYSSPKHHCALTALSNTCIVCDHAATLNIFFFPLSSRCSHFLKLFFDYFRWIFLSQILAWLHKHKFSLYFSLLYYFSPKNTVCKLTVHQQREGSRVRNQNPPLLGSRNLYVFRSLCPALTQWTEHWHHFLKSQQHDCIQKTKQSSANYG